MPSQSFKVDEMLNKRTKNTKTWMNFDGSYTTEIHSGTVHFDDGSNNLHNINTSLYDEADADSYEGPVSKHGKNMLNHEKEKVKEKKKKGKMNREDFDYQVPTLPFSIQIPKNIKKGYSIGQNEEFVRFIPQNVSPSKGFVNRSKTNEIQYQDAWNDTDVLLEVTDRGVKETLILKTDRAPFAFSFELDGAIEDDLTMGNMKLEPAWLIDSLGEKRDVAQTIRRVGDITYIDLVADVTGLTYPIEIDPTVVIQPDSTTGKDATIRSDSPTSNISTYDYMYAGRWDATQIHRSLIQFDMSQIPQGVFLNNADLTLYMSSDSMNVAEFTFNAHLITSPWEKSTVTWANRPTYDDNIYNSAQIGETLQAYSFSILNLVNKWVNGTNNNGLLLKGYEEVSNTKLLQFRTSRAVTVSQRPKLTITYNVPPTAPTVTSPNGGETWNSSHAVEWLPSIDGEYREVRVSQNSTGQHGNYSGKVGQIYKVVNTGKIKNVSFYTNTTGSSTVTLRVKDTNGSGLPGGTTLATKTQNVTLTTGGKITFELDSPVSVTSGQKVAFELDITGTAFTLIGSTTETYPDGNAFSGGFVQTHDFKIDVMEFAFAEATNAKMVNITDNGVSVVSSYRIAGQIITLTDGGHLSKVTMYIGGTTTGFNGTFTVRNAVFQSGTIYHPGATIYATKRETNMPGTPTVYTLDINPTIYFPPGTKLAVDFEYDASMYGTWYGSTTNVYNDGHVYYSDNRTTFNASINSDMNMKFYYIEGTPQNALQYQIQLSTDNGTNWSDIVALTTAGAVQYVHDFINAPQTSTAKIRIRAYDGSAYGPWDESDGVFSIIHNLAPTAPTNLTPVTTKDRAGIIRFGWTHNDPNADAQSKFDLDYRLQGSPTWITVTQNTINQFYDMPAGTLSRGTYEWRIRTYDQADLSGPYSDIKTFLAGDKPAKPTTLSPVDGSTVSVSMPTVQWSSVGQVGYTLKVLDATKTTTLWETTQTSNNKAHTIGYNLENETNYTIRLTIKNSDGINSDVEESNIYVSYTPPAKALIAVVIDNSRGSIELTIDNPAPIGTEPIVSSNDIYRKGPGQTEFVRIAVDVIGSFIDYTPAHGKVYQYYVKSFGENGTFRDSDITSGSAVFESAQLALTSDYSKWVKMKKGASRNKDKSIERAMSKFAGRPQAMAEYGEHEEWMANVSFLIFDVEELNMLDHLIESRETLLYRDNFGKREFVSVAGYSSEDHPSGWWNVSLTAEKVYFVEVI